MTAMLRFMDLTDEQVVKWVVYTLSENGWHNIRNYPLIFIVTKDRRFEESSRLKFITSRTHLNGVGDRIKIIAPGVDENIRTYKKRKLLKWIEYKLNKYWNRLSPT